MPRVPFGLVIVVALACGCGGDEEGPRDAGADAAPADAGPGPVERACREDPIEDPEPSGPLEVGFGRASLAWRVGAKPGQVGTAALPVRDAFFGDAVGELLPIVRRPPASMLPTLTDWALEHLEARATSVTPGVYNGFFEPSMGIELPSDVRAVVVRRGHRKVAIVRADLYIMHEQLQRRVAELVEDDTGIGRDQLLLVGTHNHSAAHALSAAPGVWTRADAFDPRHFVYATRRIAEAIREADAALQPTELRVERRGFSDVQRNIIGPGRAMVAPDEGMPAEEVGVGYPVEHFHDQILILRFDAPTGEPLGFVFVLGLHPESLTEGHGLLSGEWPLHVEAQIAERAGVPSMWLPGPLGDIEPDRGEVDEEHVYFRAGFDAMYEMVDVIAAAVLAGFEAAGERPADPEPRFAQIACDLPGPADHPVPDLAEIGPRLPMPRVVQDSTRARVHLVRLGDSLLVGLPAEITTDVALDIESRLDPEPGNVYQGFVWPDAPEWVRARIGRNFSTDELGADVGAPMPAVVSVANGYFGYVVTRWEYENREHYRQSMTFFGPGTADHLASGAVALAREMMGGPPARVVEQPWHDVDRQGADAIAAWLASLEPAVTEMSRAHPASDPSLVGTVVSGPAFDLTERIVRLVWEGATNDMEPPTVYVERETAAGEWELYRRGPGRDLTLGFEPPSRWSLVWRLAPDELAGERVRLRVEGTYRGPTPGSSAPDPLFDPDGADRPYTVAGDPFDVPAM